MLYRTTDITKNYRTTDVIKNVTKLTEAESRLYENILLELGIIKDFLQDDDVKEILVNDNHSMFIDTASRGFVYIVG